MELFPFESCSIVYERQWNVTDITNDPLSSLSFRPCMPTWLPDGYSQNFRSYVFGPSGLLNYGSSRLRCKT